MEFFARLRAWIDEEANFFRVHLIFFTFTPLIFAAIFWGVNGEFPVDALFLCYSALTVTGLSTVNLSSLTVLQQVILLLLMIMGNVTIVAWVMVLVRLRYFRQHITAVHRKKALRHRLGSRITGMLSGMRPSFTRNRAAEGEIRASDGLGAALAGGATTGLGLGIALGTRDATVSPGIEQHAPSPIGSNNIRIEVESPEPYEGDHPQQAHFDDSPTPTEGMIADANSFTSSPRSGAVPLSPLSVTFGDLGEPHHAPAPQPQGLRRRGVPVPRRRTILVPPKDVVLPGEKPALGQRAKDQGLGGFPGPIELGRRIARKMFPKAYKTVKRSMTIMPPVQSAADQPIKWLPEGVSDLVIGRNSHFNTEELSDDQLEELGGIEYRALSLLSYLVLFYFIGTQLITFILVAPWLSTTTEYDDVFASQPRLVNKSWFMVFQTVGAYTGGGMSLVDTGMVPFQQAYLMIFSVIFVILAGNHGLPIFLRLTIWIYTKFVKEDGLKDQVLHFLLDHPRRCFLYLFPSHVTWFLLATLTTFTLLEWAAFNVLDLGLEVIESLPVGSRVVAGLFQSFAVRASGFPIVSISSLAPSFQFLCIVMMYIAVYPVALSIRSTNVYEEKSLGVFEDSPDEDDEEPNLDEKQPRRERIGKYFGWHLRRQVAFDIWWLVWAIFLICIVERTKIMDDNNAPWFNLFRILFELVSAFGGIGLTLGIPTENYSFSGAFSPLSKLIVIVIMVRGRHRGLPVAIDRAILLPEDLVPQHKLQHPDPSAANPDIGLAEKGQGIAVTSTPLP